MSNNKYLTIGIAVSLAVMAVVSTDFYVPAMPDMVNQLNTSHYLIKLTVSVFMFGLAFSPLVFGPISDRYGRRPVLLFVAALGLAGTLLCLASSEVYMLILGRLVQGIGLGGSLSLARTIGNDLFDKQEFAQVASIISLATSTGPAIAPVIGGYLHVQFGWRSIFLLLSILIATSFILIIRKVPETIEKRDCNALRFRTLIGNYRDILTNRLFMFNTIAAGLAVSMLILFGVLSTFIFQNHYHLTSMQYAWIMMLVTAASVLSRTANIFILRRTTPETCIQIGLYFMLSGALSALTMSILEMHFVFCIIIPAMISILGAGLIPSNTMVIALAPLRQKGGTAGAIYGSITMLCVFLVSCAGSILPTSSLSLALIFLALSLLSWIMIKVSVAASVVVESPI